jgi:leucyl-tRNA synthetase
LTHKAIKKVTQDYKELSFNTVIASLMEFTNELYKLKTEGFSDAQWKESLKVLLQRVAPLAPHVADELWTDLGEKDFIQKAIWPNWDEDLVHDQTMTIVVQVNGKVRAKLTVDINESQENIIKKAKENSHVASYLGY